MRTKKFLSFIVICIMLIQAFSIVSYANETVDIQNDILYMDTFDYYSGTGSPAGMTTAFKDQTGMNQTKGSGFQAYAETDGSVTVLNTHDAIQDNSSLNSRNGAWDVIPFGKIVTSGKLHVSMDVYVPYYKWQNGAYSDTNRVGGGFGLTLFNDSAVDTVGSNGLTYKGNGKELDKFYACDNSSAESPHQTQLIKFAPHWYSQQGKQELGSFSVVSTRLAKVTGNPVEITPYPYKFAKFEGMDRWLEVDIIIDLDTKITSADGNYEGHNITVYLDGEKMKEGGSTVWKKTDNATGFKGLGFYFDNYNTTGWRYDNVYVNHFTGEMDGVRPIVSVAEDRTELSVAFSEYLSGAKPEGSGFVIENLTTGGEIEVAEAVDLTRCYKLKFETPLTAGKYRIKNASAVGVVSGKTAGDGTIFFVSDDKPVFDKISLYSYKNELVSSTCNNVDENNEETIVADAGLREIKVAFSQNLDNNDYSDYLYLVDENGQIVDNVEYDVVGKTVVLRPQDILNAGETYTVHVDEANAMSILGYNVKIPIEGQEIYETFEEAFVVDRDNGVVAISTKLFKTELGMKENTILLAAYKNTTLADGSEVLTLLDSKWVKFDKEEKGIFNKSLRMDLPIGTDFVRGYMIQEPAWILLNNTIFEQSMN